MTPISPAPITEELIHPPEIDEIPTQQEVSDVSDISTPSMLARSVNVWRHLQTSGYFSLTNTKEPLLLRARPPLLRPHEGKSEN